MDDFDFSVSIRPNRSTLYSGWYCWHIKAEGCDYLPPEFHEGGFETYEACANNLTEFLKVWLAARMMTNPLESPDHE